MSKGGGQTTTTSLPPHVTQAQKDYIDMAGRLTGNFTGVTPNYMVAGFTPDQIAAMNMGRNYAMSPVNMRMGDLTQDEIGQYTNPHTSEVIDTTLDRMRSEQDIRQNHLGARLAKAGAFGGSREAVMRAALERDYGDRAAGVTANLNQQGFDNAIQTSMGMRNLGMGQQSLADQLMRQRIATLYGMGGAQQNLAQQALMTPFNAMQMFGQAVPMATGSTQTTSKSGSPLAGLLGAGLTLGSFGLPGGGTVGGKLLGGLFGA